MEKTIEFVDAQQMAKDHPKTFEAPTKKELKGVKKGDSVKVSTGDERFWVTVTKVKGDKVTGTIDNHLVCSDEHGLNYDDEIVFDKKHIYTIFVIPKQLKK